MSRVQSWFKASIAEAGRGVVLSTGGPADYDTPGRELGRHWEDVFEADKETERLQDKLREICVMPGNQVPEALKLLEDYFSDFLEMVPNKSHDNFAWGFLCGVADAEGYDPPTKPFKR